MKRNGGILTFLTIVFSSLVTAGPVQGIEQLAEGLGEVIVIVIRFVADTILSIESFDEFLFAKLLLLLLVYFITYTVIKQNDIFGTDKKITIIISSAISILAIRYMPTEFVRAILLQYGALAVGITTLLPLLVYFFFIHQSGIGHRGRQIGWMLYGAALIALAGLRYRDLGSANYIYYAGIIGVVISILLDRPIHTQFDEAERRAMMRGRDIRHFIELEAQINSMEDKMNSLNLRGSKKAAAEKVLKGWKERAKELGKRIS